MKLDLNVGYILFLMRCLYECCMSFMFLSLHSLLLVCHNIRCSWFFGSCQIKLVSALKLSVSNESVSYVPVRCLDLFHLFSLLYSTDIVIIASLWSSTSAAGETVQNFLVLPDSNWCGRRSLYVGFVSDIEECECGMLFINVSSSSSFFVFLTMKFKWFRCF